MKGGRSPSQCPEVNSCRMAFTIQTIHDIKTCFCWWSDIYTWRRVLLMSMTMFPLPFPWQQVCNYNPTFVMGRGSLQHQPPFVSSISTLNGHWIYSLNWKIAWKYTQTLEGQGWGGKLSSINPEYESILYSQKTDYFESWFQFAVFLWLSILRLKQRNCDQDHQEGPPSTLFFLAVRWRQDGR